MTGTWPALHRSNYHVLALASISCGLGTDLRKKLAAQLMQRLRDKFCKDVAGLRGFEQSSLLVHILERLVLLLVHCRLPLRSDQCLHVCVDPSWLDRYTRNVWVFSSEMLSNRLDSGFRRAVGTPCAIGFDSRATGYPDQCAFGLQ